MNRYDRHENELVQPGNLPALVRLLADRAANPSRHTTKICFWLGAGADISSGGRSFTDLKRQALEDFTKTSIFDITPAEEIDERFDALFRDLQPDERALLVESLFRRMQPLAPSDAYKVLVLLADAGGIDAVITTNFDIMLEFAQEQLGRDPFQVFAPGLARPYLLSERPFEFSKKPYLKLHGDIASRSVVQLTQSELERGGYDDSMLELLRTIIGTHDVVFAGYSGLDKALAQLVIDALKGATTRMFWCSPRAPSANSLLYTKLADRIRFVATTFDDLMMAVGRPVLERPSLAPTRPTYLRCLFEWRVDYSNREYIHAYGERSGKSIVDLFARRRTIEERLNSFLLPGRPLAIVAGPSGYGKTTLGIRLHKMWQSDSSTRVLLVRCRTLPASGDIEQHICEQLGGLGSHAPFSVFELERWLKETGIRLVLYIDAINEFSPDLSRCIQLFRSILRFCYFLSDSDSALRIIATIRQETWQAMLPHLDSNQLHKTIWTEGGWNESLGAIACGTFTDDELQEALGKYRDHGYASINTNVLTPTMATQLRDPYLLGLLAEAAHQGLPGIPTAQLYQRAFEAKLSRRGSLIDAATLKDILASTALMCLSSQRDRIRETDILPPALRGEVTRVAKDLHVLVEAGDGFLQFDHDRTFEYFLALGFASGNGPKLETVDQLRDFLRGFRNQSKPIAAARLYFHLAPGERFAIIAAALQLLDRLDSSYDQDDRELLFGFAREVLGEMAEQGQPLVEQYLKDAVSEARSGSVGDHHLRAVVQAAAALPIERAVSLLASVAHVASSLAKTEAEIYATDKLVKHFLMSGCPAVDLLVQNPYSLFFADATIAPWERLGRLLGFSAQLGPDNTHPLEYASTYTALGGTLEVLLQERPWRDSDAAELSKFFLANCDRLLFNATPHGINRFFGNPRRRDLEGILDKLAAGSVLDSQDYTIVEPYTQSLVSDVEYHLSHAFFILSCLNDVEATLRLAESRFGLLTNASPPEEADFLEAVLVYLHVLRNLAYNEERFASWEEVILTERPNLLLYRPGLERGERRGFRDSFDRIFEDGFGVIYPYGVLLPSLYRCRTRYAEYRRNLAVATSTPLPMYSQHLQQFLRMNRIEEALQVLQALAAVVVVWPTEGLLALKDVIGYPEPRIRRATVRILAEAFNRHPDETLEFLKTSGVPVTDDDLLEIKIRQDARIGRRQVNEEEWARIGHFLFGRTGAREAFTACLRAVLGAANFEDAVSGILQTLGFIAAAER